VTNGLRNAPNAPDLSCLGKQVDFATEFKKPYVLGVKMPRLPNFLPWKEPVRLEINQTLSCCAKSERVKRQYGTTILSHSRIGRTQVLVSQLIQAPIALHKGATQRQANGP
jgi:hypothetical protein